LIVSIQPEYKHIGGKPYVLIFAKKRKVKQDGQRGGVGSEDDNFRGTTIESLGS
jgi:hypothetical protein